MSKSSLMEWINMDITFCSRECESKECYRHKNHIIPGYLVSIGDMYSEDNPLCEGMVSKETEDNICEVE